MLPTLAAELATRIGERIELATDDTLFEGVLSRVSGELLSIVQTSNYSGGTVLHISLNAINYVSFPR